MVSSVQEPELTSPGFTTVLIHPCELNCVLAGNQVLLWSPPYSASDWLASWLRLIQTVSSHSRSVNVRFLRFISCSCSGKHTDLFGFPPWTDTDSCLCRTSVAGSPAAAPPPGLSAPTLTTFNQGLKTFLLLLLFIEPIVRL